MVMCLICYFRVFSLLLEAKIADDVSFVLEGVFVVKCLANHSI